MRSIQILASFLLKAFLAAVCINAWAQDYPLKPIRLIVPMPPAGTTDNMGRLVAQKMSELLGQVVVVENKAGANGNIGSDFVSKAAPDGYTLLVSGVGSQGINATLYRAMPYDIIDGLTHIGMIAKGPNALVVNPAFPAKTLSELVALIRASPGKYNYASTGNGASNHLSMEMLKSAADLNMAHIPYKGGAPQVTALVSGETQASLATISTVLMHIQSGRLRALGVAGLKRSSSLPNLPTISEAGVPGYEMSPWVGAFVPAGTPKAIVDKLNAEINRALKHPDVLQNLTTQAIDTWSSTPEEFDQRLKADYDKYAKLIKLTGATVE